MSGTNKMTSDEKRVIHDAIYCAILDHGGQMTAQQICVQTGYSYVTLGNALNRAPNTFEVERDGRKILGIDLTPALRQHNKGAA